MLRYYSATRPDRVLGLISIIGMFRLCLIADRALGLFAIDGYMVIW
ncbi:MULTISPECIES: hypothetical protein [Planktothricoides]|uniref:Uncharacterized protein n=2 Tax=Planktothricoides raciborskii TaxID=132608 RepID=A0AAU8JF24_9CYAN|nr:MULTISPECIES: hypothetical protein [Planktothricoides]MBD2542296.1 hypothetical protein [Planktothricoides raciborskii FACHB-1370]MBD2585888.1 hypothetical protein [Planktothricoides raciborskii FACHB-1261]